MISIPSLCLFTYSSVLIYYYFYMWPLLFPHHSLTRYSFFKNLIYIYLYIYFIYLHFIFFIFPLYVIFLIFFYDFFKLLFVGHKHLFLLFIHTFFSSSSSHSLHQCIVYLFCI
ncbi:hypothetical protein F4703DRAFT_1068662 [Phycomyces blakesleeanus]